MTLIYSHLIPTSLYTPSSLPYLSTLPKSSTHLLIPTSCLLPPITYLYPYFPLPITQYPLPITQYLSVSSSLIRHPLPLSYPYLLILMYLRMILLKVVRGISIAKVGSYEGYLSLTDPCNRYGLVSKQGTSAL